MEYIMNLKQVPQLHAGDGLLPTLTPQQIKTKQSIAKCKDVQSIIEIFAEVLKHPERCSDFDLLNVSVAI